MMNKRGIGLVLATLLAAAPSAAAVDVWVSGAQVNDGDDHRSVKVVRADATRGFLGVEALGLSGDLRAHYGAPSESGVLISKVVADSPAAAAGLEVGDVITAVDGDAVASTWDLRRLIGKRDGGEEVEVATVRDGDLRVVTATLDEREGMVVDLAPMIEVDGDGSYHFRIDPERWERLGERIGEQMERWGEAFGRDAQIATERAVEEAMRALEDEEIEVQIERQLVERRAMERELEELERQLEAMQEQLEEVERQLADER